MSYRIFPSSTLLKNNKAIPIPRTIPTRTFTPKLSQPDIAYKKLHFGHFLPEHFQLELSWTGYFPPGYFPQRTFPILSFSTAHFPPGQIPIPNISHTKFLYLDTIAYFAFPPGYFSHRKFPSQNLIKKRLHCSIRMPATFQPDVIFSRNKKTI